MRYRKHSKIKMKHGLIDGLEVFLRSIEDWQEIEAIIPGPIRLGRYNQNLELKVSEIIKSGLRCFAKSHGAIQDVYIISKCPLELRAKINAL